MRLRAVELIDLYRWAIENGHAGQTFTVRPAPGVFLVVEVAPARN